MTPSGRFAGAIELLDEIYATPRPADATVSAYFRNRRFIGAKDRAAIAERVYRALRHHARLQWWIERKSTVPPFARARIIADAVITDQIKLATMMELFSGGQFAPVKLDQDERGFIERLQGRTLTHPSMDKSIAVECPGWAEPLLQDSLGDRFHNELEALIPPATLDLRINELKASRDTILQQLRDEGLDATATPLSPVGIRLAARVPIMAHKQFRDGTIEIQDEGSQLVGLLADAEPGHAVLDYCAGAGGKTLAVAARMQNKGRIVACDVLEGRLKRARERFKRAGLQNVETRLLEGATDQWLKRRKASFDRVLVDAPCSGIGTWRRNPDMRWRPLGPGLSELIPLQLDILTRASALVKSGGRLIYATCSILKQENEDIIAAFLESAEGKFSILPLSESWTKTIGTEPPCSDPYLRLTPARHGTDGFFTALLVRAL